MKNNANTRRCMENDILRKIPKDFGRNGSCTQYCYHKIESGIFSKYVHVTRLCTKLYWRCIPHVKSTQEKYFTKPWHHMSEQKIWWARNKKKNTKANNFIPKDEDYSYNWAHVQMDVRVSNSWFHMRYSSEKILKEIPWKFPAPNFLIFIYTHYF